MSVATPSALPESASLPGAGPRMDRAFLREHQIIERYLAGRLPVKGASDFEQFCRSHPELLDEIGLGERIHAALRLLEAGGRALPWEPKPTRWWQKLPALLGAAGAGVVLAILCLVLHSHLASARGRVHELQQRLASQPLDPTVSTRAIRLMPSRTGPMAASLATIGGGAAEFAELKISMGWSRYRSFDLSLDRAGQGRVAIVHDLARDSNGDLRLDLNSSSLGPGDYQVTIDGLTWSGAPVSQAWLTFSIAH